MFGKICDFSILRPWNVYSHLNSYYEETSWNSHKKRDLNWPHFMTYSSQVSS